MTSLTEWVWEYTESKASGKYSTRLKVGMMTETEKLSVPDGSTILQEASEIRIRELELRSNHNPVRK